MSSIASSSVVIVVVALSLVLLLAYLCLLSARRAKSPDPAVVAMGVAIGLCAWLGFTACFARLGVFEFAPGKIPLEPLLPVSLLFTLILLSRTRLFGRMIETIPVWQPVALQTFRVGAESAFWLAFREGIAPVQVTFEGRNFDVVVGLTAPIVAILIARSVFKPGWVIAWNAFGISCLLNAVFTVATSAPGPQHLHWPGEPFTELGNWPVIWIPAMFVPLGLFLHIVSIRQSLRALGTRPVSPDAKSDAKVERWSGSRQPAAMGGHHHGR